MLDFFYKFFHFIKKKIFNILFKIKKIYIPILINFDLKKKISAQGDFLDYKTKEKLTTQQAINNLFEGKIVLCRSFLQNNDLIKDLEICIGEKSKNFEKMHKIYSTNDLLKKIPASRLSKKTLSFQVKICIIIAELLKKNKFYCELEPNIRIHPPFEFVKKNVLQIERKLGSGQMSPHAVHKDSFYLHPKNTLNIWVASTNTDENSGLSILENSQDYYPSTIGKDILADSADAISSEHVSVNLQKGDCIIFLAELMHGSIINQTEDTRVTMSMRMSLNRPKEQTSKKYWYKKIKKNSEGIWKFMSFIEKDETNFDPKNMQNKKNKFKTKNNFNALNVEKNKNYIFIKNKKNEVFKFPRRCPHNKADLINGFFDEKNKCIVCPIHRLRVKNLEI